MPGPRRQYGSAVHLETFNGSSWASIQDRLTRTEAMVVFAQETRLQDRAARAAASQRVHTDGWKMAGGLGLSTLKGSTSSGVAVLVRRHIEVGPIHTLAGSPEPFTIVPGRAEAVWINSWVKGGFIAVSVYLKDGVGMDDDNWAVLLRVGEALALCGQPFIIGGDFNMHPQVITDAGWTRRLRARAVYTTEGTCRGATGSYTKLDYFVVEEGLAKAIQAVARDPQEPARPHRPVVLTATARPRAIQEQVMKAPAKFPAQWPIGCAPAPPNWNFEYEAGGLTGQERQDAHYKFLLDGI